jgi:hypothetical protein
MIRTIGAPGDGMHVPRERNAGAAAWIIRILLIHNRMDQTAKTGRRGRNIVFRCNGCSLRDAARLAG